MITKYQTATSTRGKYKCNLCRTNLSPKEGDWFEPVGAGGQQIFLCKSCETSKKAEFRRVSLSQK